MKRQQEYDEALALLDKLEKLLGTELSVFAYDGEDPRRELWYKFATEEEIEARHEERRKREVQYYEDNPYSILGKLTMKWAENKMLEHASPISMLEKFADGKPDTIKFRRPVPYGTEENK